VIRLLELATDRELARLADPNQDAPNFLAFTPDGGKLLVSSDFAHAFHVWDLRAIRAQLAEMGLDWDSPPLPPAPPVSPEPIQIQVDLGNFQNLADAVKRVQQAGGNVQAKGALTALREAVQLAPEYATPHNNLAWLLLTGPKELRDSAQALVEARKAVELEPWQWSYSNTLGVALYRNEKFAEAIPALERSLREQRGQADAFDLFFLAMCHHRLDDAARAKDCHERGKQWFQKHKGKLSARWVAELAAFQAESESVLAQPPGQAKRLGKTNCKDTERTGKTLGR
jgi:tetratricopeptide (TPR) repeat protein